jgi:hypothetical protein
MGRTTKPRRAAQCTLEMGRVNSPGHPLPDDRARVAWGVIARVARKRKGSAQSKELTDRPLCDVGLSRIATDSV